MANPFVVLHCPHCNTEEISCDISGIREKRVQLHNMYCGYMTVFCKGCSKPIGLEITASFRDTKAIDILDSLNIPICENINLMSYIGIEKMWPPLATPYTSHFLPQDVRQAAHDAEQALIANVSPRIARGAFRTVLDVATNEVLRQNPGCLGDKTAKNLNTRIDMLAKAGLLTTDLKDWAHGVRGITNEDVHTVEPVSKEEAQEIAEITRLILTYLFELPERVKLAKAVAEAKKDEGNG